ncbi:hypothetical protein EXIGLDRAFT_732082 [Exidia glandulosa HHB12029]|uniref:Uncharacterized protein n=1 Tax=Exidia glandulosa HHB12029 TaxID=1314781 RepID=A0A165BN40_EXIGL|nr:hypothetical protein EXIGLDRAFT_732082 [Exidia glandulosa HHB12029]
MVLDRDGNEDNDGVFDSEVWDENDCDDEEDVVVNESEEVEVVLVDRLLMAEPDDSVDDAELKERVVDGKPLTAVVDDAVVYGVVDVANVHDSEDDAAADAVDTTEADSDAAASRESVFSIVDMKTPLPSASVTSAGAMLASSILGVPEKNDVLDWSEPRCEVLVTCLRRIAPAGSCP